MVALRRPLAAGALAGAVAGATVCALQALLRLALDLPSAAELIGDRVAERIPVRPFLDVLDALGGYNRVKALSVAATIAGTLALGAAGGVLYARKAGREEQARASGRIELPGSAVVRLLIAVTLGWVVVAAALWPLLGTYAGGEQATTARAANLAALGLAASTYVVVLVACQRLIAAPGDAGTEGVSPAVGRCWSVGPDLAWSWPPEVRLFPCIGGRHCATTGCRSTATSPLSRPTTGSTSSPRTS